MPTSRWPSPLPSPCSGLSGAARRRRKPIGRWQTSSRPSIPISPSRPWSSRGATTSPRCRPSGPAAIRRSFPTCSSCGPRLATPPMVCWKTFSPGSRRAATTWTTTGRLCWNRPCTRVTSTASPVTSAWRRSTTTKTSLTRLGWGTPPMSGPGTTCWRPPKS